MQTQIHAESLMISLGMLPVPEHMYRSRQLPQIQKRYIRSNELTDLIDNIIKRKTNLGSIATSEFIYYEMLETGLIPSEDGVPLVSIDTFSGYYTFANRKIARKHIRETKTCLSCKKIFERNLTTPPHKWRKQQFCSRKCACINTVAQRVSKANERKQRAI